MANLTLNDIKLFLDDLVRERVPEDPPNEPLKRELLLQLSCGPTYLSLFEKKRNELNALPPAVLRDRPLSEELSTANDDYDGYGRFLYYMAEAYQHLPGEPPEVAKEAREIQETFIPVLKELLVTYADQAALARDRRPLLAAKAELLKRFPVRGGKSAFEVASAMLDRGLLIDRLLIERASLSAQQEQEGRLLARGFRSELIGLVNRCRQAIADELLVRESLPRSLGDRIFSYYDLLEKQRAEAARSTPATSQTPQASAPTPAPTDSAPAPTDAPPTPDAPPLASTSPEAPAASSAPTGEGSSTPSA